MGNNNFEKYKECLLRTFESTLYFLNKHNLKWFAAGGTCLGAIRHQGIIPWDDDVDIFMPRTDYDRLLSLKDELNSEGILELHALETEFGYNHTYAKIMNTHTTVWEQDYAPRIDGVWVDVFALDNTNVGSLGFQKIYEKYKLKFNSGYARFLYPANAKRLLQAIINLEFISFFKTIFSNERKQKQLYDDFLSFSNQFRSTNGVNIVSYSASAHLFKADWFSNYLEYPFDGLIVRVPKEFDNYLSIVYGDYMTPPNPIPEYSHSMYYVNLKERISLEEAKKRVKKGIHFEC